MYLGEGDLRGLAGGVGVAVSLKCRYTTSTQAILVGVLTATASTLTMVLLAM